jgi:hypothetical protein
MWLAVFPTRACDGDDVVDITATEAAKRNAREMQMKVFMFVSKSAPDATGDGAIAAEPTWALETQARI